MTDDIDTAITMTGQHYTAAVRWEQVAIDEAWQTGVPDRHITDDQLAALPTMSLTLIHSRNGTKVTFGFGDSLATITHTYIDAVPRSPFIGLDLVEAA